MELPFRMLAITFGSIAINMPNISGNSNRFIIGMRGLLRRKRGRLWFEICIVKEVSEQYKIRCIHHAAVSNIFPADLTEELAFALDLVRSCDDEDHPSPSGKSAK